MLTGISISLFNGNQEFPTVEKLYMTVVILASVYRIIVENVARTGPYIKYSTPVKPLLTALIPA